MDVKVATCAIVGTGASASGTAVSALTANEVLTTICLVLTILGFILNFIVIPILSKISKAKADGKITAEEAVEIAKTASDGVIKVINEAENLKKGE